MKRKQVQERGTEMSTNNIVLQFAGFVKRNLVHDSALTSNLA